MRANRSQTDLPRLAVRDTTAWPSKVACCAALVLLLLWPAIYNGQPLFSADTSAYLRGFDAGIVWLTGHTSAWTTWAAEFAGAQKEAYPSTGAGTAGLQDPTFVIAGRSVAYGALLYLGELFGGLWTSIVIQAGAVLAALALTLRHLNLFSWPRLVIATASLGLGSTLPFFASFLLPDLFAGLSILAAANLFALGDRMNRWEWTFWLLILAAAVVFHPTHLAVVLMILIAVAIARIFIKKISLSGIAALTIAVAIGFVGEF